MRATGWGHGCLRLVGTMLLAIAVTSGVSRAGGLYVQEFGTPSQAMAGAGANALAENAATSFQNPAGMTRLDDHQAMATAGFLAGTIKFDSTDSPVNSGGNGGEQGGFGPVLGAMYVHRLSERFRAGLSLVSISGAVLDPDNDWAGRFQVQELSLITLSMFPTLAVRLTDSFSVGGGANVIYGRLNYKLAAPLPGPGEGQVDLEDLDDFEAGAVVSFLWEPTEQTRFGALWQQKIDLDLEGDVKLKGSGLNASATTKIPLVEAVRASLVHEFGDDLQVGASFRWERWSEFDDQFVRVGSGTGALPRDWKDTYGGSLGLRAQLTPKWAALVGAGYDSSPVSRSDRTADMPIDEQYRLGVGAQYLGFENRVVGANFSWTHLGEAKIRSSSLRGKYDRNELFSLTFYVSFDKLPWSALD